jgi:hypothetical protein
MLNPRDAYLHALNHALLQASEPAVAYAVRSEIEAHLDAAIQARLELGDAYEEAVERSVAALGPPQSYATQISEVHTPQVVHAERRMLKAAWGLAAVAMSYLLTLPIGPGYIGYATYLAAYFSAVLLCLALVFAFSFLSRRLAMRSLAKIGAVVGFGVWGTLATIWLDLGPEGGLGVMTRAEAAHSLRSHATRNAEFERQLDSLAVTVRDRAARGESVTALVRQREELQMKLDENQCRSSLVTAAANRSFVERAMDTFGSAFLTGVAVSFALFLFNCMGVLMGRSWHRRGMGRKARA